MSYKKNKKNLICLSVTIFVIIEYTNMKIFFLHLQLLKAYVNGVIYGTFLAHVAMHWLKLFKCQMFYRQIDCQYLSINRSLYRLSSQY